jgi:hypothetical protein
MAHDPNSKGLKRRTGVARNAIADVYKYAKYKSVNEGL